MKIIGWILYYRFKYRYKSPQDINWTETWSFWHQHDNRKIYMTKKIGIEASIYINKNSNCEFKIAPLYLNEEELEEI